MPEQQAGGYPIFDTEGAGEQEEQEAMDDSLPGDAQRGDGQAAAGPAEGDPARSTSLREEIFPVLTDPVSQEPSHIALAEAEIDEEKTPEWQAMPEIPQEWRPLPLFLVRNIPAGDGGSEADVQVLLEDRLGIPVRSVALEERKGTGRRTAFVRLHPPPLPWQSKDAPEKEKGRSKGPPRDGDAASVAAWAVARLKASQPPLQLAGGPLGFETAGQALVQLYVGNLSPEWQVDASFQEAMGAYGRLERAFVVRNAAGLSKGYGFAEFALPSGAQACKQAMDDIERRMRPDHRPRSGQAQGQGQGQQQQQAEQAAALRLGSDPGGRLVKLLRAEWASLRRPELLFSRVLYVANLRTHQASGQELHDIFSQFGRVSEVTVPRNKATNSTKGFAFVAFANGLAADRAYRALEKSGSEEIGGALVSFANPAKAADPQRREGGPRPPNQPRPPAGMPGRGMPPFPTAGGRGMPGRGRAGLAGRGDGGLRQQQLHLQAGMAAQARLGQQLELRVQQRLAAQQAALQAQAQASVSAQLRQAQLQLQQAQAQAAAAQQAAAAAQARAAAEAEARRRAEEEARRVAAAQAVRVGSAGKQAGGYGGFGSQAGYGTSSGFGPSSGGSGYGATASAGFGAQAGYDTSQAGYSGYGYGGGQDAAASTGYGAEYGGGEDASGYAGYGAGGYGEDSYAGYGSGTAAAGYGDQAASASGGRGGYGSGSAADYSGYGTGAEGYGGADVAYEQHAAYAGYGGSAGGNTRKRSAPYSQAGTYGASGGSSSGYGSGGYGGGGYSSGSGGYGTTGGSGYGGAAGGGYGSAAGGYGGGGYGKRQRY